MKKRWIILAVVLIFLIIFGIKFYSHIKIKNYNNLYIQQTACIYRCPEITLDNSSTKISSPECVGDCINAFPYLDYFNKPRTVSIANEIGGLCYSRSQGISNDQERNEYYSRCIKEEYLKHADRLSGMIN